MSALHQHLCDLKLFAGGDNGKLWTPAGTVLVVNMVASHLDELIALAALSDDSMQSFDPRPIGQCSLCGINRMKENCPRGYTKDCPMVGTAYGPPA